MDLDAKTIAILIVFFGVVIGVIWDWVGSWDDTFDDFWEKLNWKDEEDEDKRNQSGKK